MSPIAKNCNAMASGSIDTPVGESSVLRARCRVDLVPIREEYVCVTMTQHRPIAIETAKFGSCENNWQSKDVRVHTIPWSAAFPHEPTLGEMIYVAEVMARGEWFKLFPEET